MKIHRFILDVDLLKSELRIAEPEVVQQMRSVLRLAVADEVLLCDGKGFEAKGVIETIDKKGVTIHLGRPARLESEPKRTVTLFCSILKKENFEWVVQKAVEVGVTQIVPVICERTVKLNLNIPRLQKIAREAAEQSGRGMVPDILQPVVLAKAFEMAQTNVKNIFFDSSGPQLNAADFVDTAAVGIFIGPEGGWSDHELQLAQKNNCAIANLGPRTLRAETAAIVATYLATL